MQYFLIFVTILTMSFSASAQSTQKEEITKNPEQEVSNNSEQGTQAGSEQNAQKNVQQQIPEKQPVTEDFIAVMLFEEMMLAANKLYNGDEDVKTSPKYFQSFGFRAIPVSLAELRETIETNELAAETAYDRPFVTTGKIEQVTRVMGTPLVKLKPGGNKLALIDTVSAKFDDKYTPQLAKLKKGDVLTVACKSWRYTMSVSISDCQLMPDFYSDYKSSTNPREIALRVCRDQKTYAFLYLVKIASKLDAIDEKTLQMGMDNLKKTNLFSNLGIGENIWEDEKYDAISNATKSLISELVELKEKGVKVENCQ